MSTVAIRPMTVSVPDSILSDLRARLAGTIWPRTIHEAGWQYGTSSDYMRRLSDHWLNSYDWRRTEAEINRFENAIATIDGYDIHFIRERGSGRSPSPLVLSHGWPGSVIEFLDLIDVLAHPERYGGDAEDGFDVIVPSLPGYGWSSAPSAPITTREMARLWQRLMVDGLGYTKYFAQGGDWGSLIASWLGLDYPTHVKAIHINMMGLRPYTGPGSAPIAPEEEAWLEVTRKRLRREDAYQRVQGTKPATLSFGLSDSPIGLAAWIIEKFQGWSVQDGTEPPFGMDRLIDNVMVYWVTNSIASSVWLYTAARHLGGMGLGRGEWIATPTGFLAFPNDLFPPPPDAWVGRVYNCVHRRDLPEGGHFAALERGRDLVDDVRAFFAKHR